MIITSPVITVYDFDTKKLGQYFATNFCFFFRSLYINLVLIHHAFQE